MVTWLDSSVSGLESIELENVLIELGWCPENSVKSRALEVVQVIQVFMSENLKGSSQTTPKQDNFTSD